ncbi:GNAT family N-acetyltransferase [Arthrobacter woluwensis]|uniref:GNAT family N-acetyltransferase n=1 Tax=Arthrobacter woluwensis TaxID=156980 RepID=UPI0037F75329
MSQHPTVGITIGSLREPEDALAFRQISEEWLTEHFQVEPEDLHALGDPQRTIIDAGGDVLLASDDASGEILGAVALVAYPEDVFELAKMGVRRTARGRGIGALLVRAAIERASALGGRRLFLSTNHALASALRLYRAAGFVSIRPDEVPVKNYYALALDRADVYLELK